MMRLLLTLSSALLVLAPLTASPQDSLAAHARWKQLAVTDSTTWDLDLATAQRDSAGARVWMRITYTQRPRRPSRRFVSYALHLVELDCVERRFRLGEVVEYAADGAIISSAANPTLNWRYAPPGSFAEEIVKLCDRTSLLDGSHYRASRAWFSTMSAHHAALTVACRSAPQGVAAPLCRELAEMTERRGEHVSAERFWVVQDSLSLLLNVSRAPLPPHEDAAQP